MDYHTEIVLWSYFTLNEVELYLSDAPKKKKKVLKYLAAQARPDLIKAAAEGDLEIVKYLLGLGNFPTTATLEWAIRSGNLAVVDCLYDKCNIRSTQKLKELINLTAELGNLEMLKYLYEKIDQGSLSSGFFRRAIITEDTLVYAVLSNSLETIKYILDAGIRAGPKAIDKAMFKPEIKALLYKHQL